MSHALRKYQTASRQFAQLPKILLIRTPRADLVLIADMSDNTIVMIGPAAPPRQPLRTTPLLTANASGAAPLRQRRCSRSRFTAGFTLLELLVVMVIVGLLVGYVGPRYFSQLGKSEVKATRAQINAFEKSLDQYRLDTGHYPSTEQGLAALVAKPGNEPKWQGPYLSKAVPADPWGNPYQYRQPGEHGEVDVWSFGKDGQPGGDGEAADVTNW